MTLLTDVQLLKASKTKEASSWQEEAISVLNMGITKKGFRVFRMLRVPCFLHAVNTFPVYKMINEVTSRWPAFLGLLNYDSWSELDDPEGM